MALTSRQIGTIGAACAIVLIAGATVAISAAATVPAQSSREPERIDLASVVAAWPTTYTVTATKSEPGYVEHITTTRAGDRFALRIVIAAQGTGAGGSSLAEVAVDSRGTVSWVAGCQTDSCVDDDAVRGFLAAASLLAASRQDRLPSTAVIRYLGDHEVVCVSDEDLFPATASTTLARLDPCFSLQSGAVLGHYSHVNAAFVGPTMNPTSIVESRPPAWDLFTDPPL